jgi:Lsr2
LIAGWGFFLLYRQEIVSQGVLMAQRTVIRLVDDLDDTEIVDGVGETVNFALDGRQYEIDLTNDHANEMRAALDRYVRAARKVGGRKGRAGAKATVTKTTAAVDYSPQAVRAWAKANKIDVSPRGRIPQSVVDRFRAAGN